MSTVSIVFSPTGGTKRVADILTQHLAEEAVTVDLSDAAGCFSDYTFGAQDTAVIAVPSFGGRVPEIAIQRLRQIKGQGARAVAVCVYGNRAYEDTLVELADAAAQAGFRVIAGVAAIAEHSIMHQYASGRPDAQDREILKEFAGKIARKLSGGSLDEPFLPGSRPYKKRGGGGLVPKAGSACTACGLCVRRCPVHAIHEYDWKRADPSKCISCMRCVADCPAQARSVSKTLVAAASMAIQKACSVRKECELYL